MTIFRLIFSYFCLIGCLILPCISSLQGEEESMVVQLATESPLVPLYLAPFLNDQTVLDDRYIRKIEQVLAFDLNHNGFTYLAKQTAENDLLTIGGSFETIGSFHDWQSKNIFYIVKGKIKGKSLQILLFDIHKQILKKIDAIDLTENLNQDRVSIHRLADLIHKALFGSEGIASTRILYTLKNSEISKNQKLISEVWEADYDGGNTHPITQEHSLCVTPVYVPPKPDYLTGSFMYVSYQLGQPKIYLANLKEGIGHRLTPLRGNQLMPSISRQRDKVAFISDVTGNPDLFLQPFSVEKGALGKPYQIFSAKQATQGSPTFSPNGEKVAFVSNKDGSPKIYIINIPPPGTSLKNIKATLITKQNRENSAPAWSSDGSKIAYCAKNKGERQIWVYDFHTDQERQVTQGPGNKENPSWAPNNLHLVFNSSDRGHIELYLINLNQTEATCITSGPGEKRFPSWEPRIKNSLGF